MALAADVKNYLDITWAMDDQEEAKINGIIDRAKSTLNIKTGVTLDYESEGRAKELLLEYCRFARDGKLNEFYGAYAPMIKDLIEEHGGTYGVQTENI